MRQSTFIIKNQKLLLKTYNRELTVEPEVNVDRIWQLALDLANLALVYKKTANSEYDYIWCSETERKVLFFLREGKTSKAMIAKKCGRSPRQIYNIVSGIKKKINQALLSQSEPEPKNIVLYQKIPVTTIPFSSLVTDEFDDEGSEIEFGDGGKGASEIISQVEDRLEDGGVYHLFDDSPRAQELMTLLVAGYSRQECANKMKVSLQEIHQKVGRIKKRLKQYGYAKTII